MRRIKKLNTEIFIEQANFESSPPKTINDLLNRLEQLFKTQPELEREIQVLLITLIAQQNKAGAETKDGYCFKFPLPLTQVNGLFKKIKTSPITVEKIFREWWDYPKNTRMYSDSYYQILLLLMLYGIKNDKSVYVDNAFFLILVKLWNGRRQEFLPFCNKPVMEYVIQNMLTGKFLATKFPTPYHLLVRHFLPTLKSKYVPEIKKDNFKLKAIFSQAYSRIYQVFSQQGKVDPATGKTISAGGLATLYYKANNQGLSTRSITVKPKDEENGPTFDQYGSSNINAEIVQTVTDYITLNKQESYPEGFIKQLNRLTHVSSKVINQMSITIHNPVFYEHITELISMILSKLYVKDKDDVCSVQFILDIKKKIIASKNNRDAERILELVDIMLKGLFKKMGLSYTGYSPVQRSQIRVCLIHIIVFNIKKIVCRQQLQQQIHFLSTLKVSDLF